MVEVRAMQHDVEGEGEAELLHPRRHGELPLEGAPPRDPIGGHSLGVLYGDLHVVEAELAKARQALAPKRNAARDQICIEVETPRFGDERLDIIAHQRLAPREVELDHAEVLRFAQDAEPGLGVELFTVLAVVEGIGTVDAAERAAIGQLGHQRVGPLSAAHATACTRPRSAMFWRKAITSRSTAGRS